MIVFEQVGKRFSGRTVLEKFDLHVEAGELFVLLGPSGCGKTTTLRLVNGLASPTAGRVLVNGADVAAVDLEELRRGIGYVIQSAGLFPHWSIADNIATVPRLLGWDAPQVDGRVDELLALLHLEPAMKPLLPRHLSGGQQQRVGVARALAADPAILLMDEPFGALDPVTRAALQDEIKAIHARTRKTIIFVTHDVDEALKLATRIGLMDRGRLVAVGTPREVLRQPPGTFAHEFLGGPELGLRLLAVETVASRATATHADDMGAPLPHGLSLREALSIMVARGRDRLAVTGADGTARSIGISDIVRP